MLSLMLLLLFCFVCFLLNLIFFCFCVCVHVDNQLTGRAHDKVKKMKPYSMMKPVSLVDLSGKKLILGLW